MLQQTTLRVHIASITKHDAFHQTSTNRGTAVCSLEVSEVRLTEHRNLTGIRGNLKERLKKWKLR